MFAMTELTTLKLLAESERLEDPSSHDMCSRLIKRIENVERKTHKTLIKEGLENGKEESKQSQGEGH